MWWWRRQRRQTIANAGTSYDGADPHANTDSNAYSHSDTNTDPYANASSDQFQHCRISPIRWSNPTWRDIRV
ncbi:MAG: hypothetical protein Pars92KO_25740 [Parasphingorhabdus sp.]